MLNGKVYDRSNDENRRKHPQNRRVVPHKGEIASSDGRFKSEDGVRHRQPSVKMLQRFRDEFKRERACACCQLQNQDHNRNESPWIAKQCHKELDYRNKRHACDDRK